MIRRFGVVIAAVMLLSGCATYKFEQSKKKDFPGYAVLRDGQTVLEYTIGKNNTLPDELELAKERFNRRKITVEDYYRKMGYMEGRFKEMVINPMAMMGDFLLGIIRIPGMMLSEYRYNHNPQYKARVDKKEAELEAKEEAELTAVKSQLARYIQEDIAKETGAVVPSVLPPTQAPVTATPAVIEASAPVQESHVSTSTPAPESLSEPAQVAESAAESAAPAEAESEPAVVSEPVAPATESLKAPEEALLVESRETLEETAQPELSVPAPKPQPEAPKVPSADVTAVIVAKPQKGYSPLTVQFSAGRSHSKKGGILHYAWDFGDGDTSNKSNPVNTFYSGTYEPKKFTVSLTVTDSKGNFGVTSAIVEVLNK